jgi:hypothetical protein
VSTKALPDLFKGDIYGVRKGDIEEIKKLSNWINFEDHIASLLTAKDTSKLLMSLVKSKLDHADILEYTSSVVTLIDARSPYAEIVNDLKGIEKFKGYPHNIDRLFRRFAPNANISPDALVTKYQQKLNDVNCRYPLLKSLSTYRTEANDIAEYINLIDAKKGV